MKSWYAIYVRPRAEKKVAAELEKAGVDHYLPLHTTLRRWSDRKKWIDLPLIPGYCFVHVAESNILDVLKVKHVFSVVRFNGKPAIVRDDHIEFLKRLLNQNEIEFKLASSMPEPGQEVEIIAGPFIGLKAEMVRINKKSTIILRLEQICNAFLLEIPVSDVVMVTATQEKSA
ncbi:MAG: UpxY family transcription antiterminator [Bacteroidota bacterium]